MKTNDTCETKHCKMERSDKFSAKKLLYFFFNFGLSPYIRRGKSNIWTIKIEKKNQRRKDKSQRMGIEWLIRTHCKPSTFITKCRERQDPII